MNLLHIWMSYSLSFDAWGLTHAELMQSTQISSTFSQPWMLEGLSVNIVLRHILSIVIILEPLSWCHAYPQSPFVKISNAKYNF